MNYYTYYANMHNIRKQMFVHFLRSKIEKEKKKLKNKKRENVSTYDYKNVSKYINKT